MDVIFEQYKDYFYIFLAIFVRTSSMLFFFPVINHPSIPRLVKIHIYLSISFMLFILYVENGGKIDTSVFQSSITIFLGIVYEILFSFLITLWVRFFLAAFFYIGDIIGMIGGFAMAQFFDPTAGQSMLVGRIFLETALVLFVLANYISIFIYIIYNSFYEVPLFHIADYSNLLNILLHKFSESFVLGIKFAMPLILILMLFNVSLSLIAKLMPQLNIFFIAIPMQVLITLWILILLMPLIIEGYLDTMDSQLNEIYHFLSSLSHKIK